MNAELLLIVVIVACMTLAYNAVSNMQFANFDKSCSVEILMAYGIMTR